MSNGRGRLIKTKAATFHRSNPGLLEQYHDNLRAKFDEEVTDGSAGVEVRDIRLIVKKKERIVQKCPCCHIEVASRLLRHCGRDVQSHRGTTV